MNAKKSVALQVADLPLILALARARTLAGAAERLDLDISTIFRRLNDVERRLRVRLFDRSPRGYQLTPTGERATAAAERIETELHALDRDITGRDQQLTGTLRATASETLSYAVLPPLLASFVRLTHASNSRWRSRTACSISVVVRQRWRCARADRPRVSCSVDAWLPSPGRSTARRSWRGPQKERAASSTSIVRA